MNGIDKQNSMNRALTMKRCFLKSAGMSTEIELKLSCLDLVMKTIATDARGLFEIA